MNRVSDFFINKHILKELKFNVSNIPDSVLDSQENSTPLSLLSVHEQCREGFMLEEVNASLIESEMMFNNDVNRKLKTMLAFYNYFDECNMVDVVYKNSDKVLQNYGLTDMTHYMFLNKYLSVNEIEEWEYENIYEYGKILKNDFISSKTVTPLGKVLDAVSPIYSKSEAFSLMFFSKEAGGLFIDESYPYSTVFNEVVYQILMNYHYYINNIVKKKFFTHSEILRVEEFLDGESRRKFYSIAKNILETQEWSAIYNKYFTEIDIIYDAQFHVIEKIQMLLISDVPISDWDEYVNIPNIWLEGLTKNTGKLWDLNRPSH